MDVIMNIRRNFYFMIAQNLLKESLQLMPQVTAQHGSNIRIFEIDTNDEKLGEQNVSSSKYLSEIVANMVKLEHLNIHIYQFQPNHDEVQCSDVTQVNLKNLKYLKIKNDNFSTFKYLSAPNIITVDVWGGAYDELEHESGKLFNIFLLSAPKLQSLILRSHSFHTFFRTKHENIPFKLKSFAENGSYSKLDESWMNFVCFLKQQATSLEDLELCRTLPEVIVTIFNYLKNLKAFHIKAFFLPTDKAFYNRLRPLKNLTKFRSNSKFANETAAKGILGNFPNLETLAVPIHPDLLSFMSINNPKLRILKIISFPTHNQAESKFKFLNSLELEIIKESEPFLFFLKNHASLVTLKINWVEDDILTEEVMTEIMTSTNLVDFTFRGHYDPIKTIMDTVASYEKLKFLRLNIVNIKGEDRYLLKPNNKVDIDNVYFRSEDEISSLEEAYAYCM